MDCIKMIIGLFILILLVSCGSEINPDDILKNESNFKLTMYVGDNNSPDSVIIKSVKKDSKIVSNMIDWLNDNPDGWQSSIASWATPEISLISNDFRLLIFNDGIVIGFTDKKGKPKQYTKQIDIQELKFLIER